MVSGSSQEHSTPTGGDCAWGISRKVRGWRNPVSEVGKIVENPGNAGLARPGSFPGLGSLRFDNFLFFPGLVGTRFASGVSAAEKWRDFVGRSAGSRLQWAGCAGRTWFSLARKAEIVAIVAADLLFFRHIYALYMRFFSIRSYHGGRRDRDAGGSK